MLKGKPFLRRAMMTKTKKSKRTLSWKNNLSKCIKNRKCLKNRKCIKSRKCIRSCRKCIRSCRKCIRSCRKCIRSCRKCLKSRTLRSRAQAKWQMPMQPRLHLRPPRSNSSISNITKPPLLLLEAKGLASFGAALSMEPRGCAAWLAILNTGVTTSSLSAATVTMVAFHHRQPPSFKCHFTAPVRPQTHSLFHNLHGTLLTCATGFQGMPPNFPGGFGFGGNPHGAKRPRPE
ncbi:hypothetical protein J3E69DRAFT_18688 [Trichoderma sp. SZMC 28015]